MRRTRAYRRHQRARTRARHVRDYYDLVSYTGGYPPPRDVAVRHPLDCGRRCELCHYGKFDRARRDREKRDAWGYEWVASEGW